MFDLFDGLPVHPLVVHAVIVLLPLTAIGAILVAARGRWNRSYGWLVLVSGVLATGSAFVAKESGEALASRIGYPEDHIELAEKTPIVAGLLLVLVAALWWLDRSQVDGRTLITKVIAVLVVLAALWAMLVTFQAGHSGATAVWKDEVADTQPGQAVDPESGGGGDTDGD